MHLNLMNRRPQNVEVNDCMAIHINFNRKVESLLENKVDIYIYDLDYAEFNGKKDANDLGASRLRKLTMRRKSLLSEVMIL